MRPQPLRNDCRVGRRAEDGPRVGICIYKILARHPHQPIQASRHLRLDRGGRVGVEGYATPPFALGLDGLGSRRLVSLVGVSGHP